MKKEKKSRYNPESPFPEQHSTSVSKRWKGTDRRLGENRTIDLFEEIVISEFVTIIVPKKRPIRFRQTLDTANYFGEDFQTVSVFEPEEKDLQPPTNWNQEFVKTITGIRYGCGHTVIAEDIIDSAEETRIRQHALTIECPDCVEERTKREHREWQERMARGYGGEPEDY